MTDIKDFKQNHDIASLALALLMIVSALVFNNPSLLAQQPQELNSVDFDQHILPLLSDRCFKCHGPDESTRESGLRLDTQEGAFSVPDSGDAAIIPGDAKSSSLYDRITSNDASLRMPPPESGLNLSAEEKELLRAWIEQGADRKSVV